MPNYRGHCWLSQGLKKNPLWAKVNLFYILLTWYARIKVEAFTCCVSTQSERLLVCYSSYSPQKIWTSICRCLHIFVTKKTKQWIFSSEKHVNSSSSPHRLAHTVELADTQKEQDNLLTSSINFCFDSNPFFAVFVNETVEGKVKMSFHSCNRFNGRHLAVTTPPVRSAILPLMRS